MSTESQADEFWRERENLKGGKIQFNTFATFLGTSGERKLDLGGLVYIINNIIYFEDFEKDNMFLKILTRKKEFKKTEFSFAMGDIRSVKEVSVGEATNCVTGIVDEGETKPISPLTRFFANPVLQLRMQGGFSYFFDIMRKKEFIEIVRS